jgi:hypothetical protein
LQGASSLSKNHVYFYREAINKTKWNKKLIPIITASKRIKCLGTNLSKDM